MIKKQPLTVESSGPEVSMQTALSMFQAATQPSILDNLGDRFIYRAQGSNAA
jgi:hypothetical protein